MPYCRKCGTELDPDSKFCHDCGNQVAPAETAPTTAAPKAKERKFPIAAIILISILAFAAVVAAITLFPLNPVSFSQSEEASAPNITTLDLMVNADVANTNIIFKELPGNQRATINVSATGSQGIFETDQPVSLSTQQKTTDQTLTYTVEISRTDSWNLVSGVHVTCEVHIDPSASLNLTVKTTAGNIYLNSDQTLTIHSLNLQTTVGSIDATVSEQTTVSESIDIKTTAGSAHLHWNEANVSGDIPITLIATTGTVTATINQGKHPSGNVTLKAETTTGGVDLALDISGGVGALIETETGILSTVNVDQTGFSSDNTPLQSDNYPAGSNFQINLKATTGTIHIDANYETGINN